MRFNLKILCDSCSHIHDIMDILRSQKQNDDFLAWLCHFNLNSKEMRIVRFCCSHLGEMISIAYGQQPPNDQHERCFATY